MKIRLKPFIDIIGVVINIIIQFRCPSIILLIYCVLRGVKKKWGGGLNK